MENGDQLPQPKREARSALSSLVNPRKKRSKSRKEKSKERVYTFEVASDDDIEMIERQMLR